MAVAAPVAPSSSGRPFAQPLPINGLGVILLVATDTFAVTAAIARFGRLTPNTIVLVVAAIWVLALGDYYRLRLDLSVLDDVVGIGVRVVAAVSLGAAYRELVSGHDVFTVDRLWVLIGAAVFVLLGRATAYGLIRWLRQRGRLRRPTVVIASSATAIEVTEALVANPSCGLVVSGPPLAFPLDDPAIGRLEGGAAIVEITDATTNDATELVRRLPASGPEIYLLPKALMHYSAAVPGADQLASLPLVPVRPAANRSLRWKLKRIIDVVIALVLIPLTAPVVALAALGLLVEGGPGVVYRQERIGLGGRRFTMFKLRTIPTDVADIEGVWNVEPHTIRPFARVCRATSIDELPQLWNVLRGDMSLVGPRPERPQYATKFAASVPDYANRHRVPVGLTGLAQVRGLRGDTSISARSRTDNSYIDNWSLFQDLKILCRTVISIITIRGRGS